MQSELNKHLEKIHEYQKTDFRWSNLRKIVMRSIVGKKILDAGCGTGHLALYLLRSGCDVTAIDYSDELVSFARKAISDAHFSANIFSGDLLSIRDYSMPFFDSIVCLDVIEHIEKDDIVLKNLNDLLKTDGTLILSVPAIKRIYGLRDKKVGHFRRYDKDELRKKIEDAGFTVSAVRYWNFIGVIPVVIFEKILHKPVYETVRYSRATLSSKILHPVLNGWFSLIENNIQFPVGLTLIAVCRKK